MPSSEGASEGTRGEAVRSDGSCPLYFIFFYKLHCLPWPDEYLIGICCFICMLYNLGPYNRNSGREAAVPALLSPTLPVLPEVPLDFLRREQGKGIEKRLMSKRVFPLVLFLSFCFCTCRSLLCYCTHAGSCI